MLKPSHPGIPEILFLRDVIIPFVKEREKGGLVNLNHTFHECGSPSCLLGWSYEKFKKNYAKTRDKELSKDEWYSLFGDRSAGTLDDRALACDKIIERMLGEVMA